MIIGKLLRADVQDAKLAVLDEQYDWLETLAEDVEELIVNERGN